MRAKKETIKTSYVDVVPPNKNATCKQTSTFKSLENTQSNLSFTKPNKNKKHQN